jgi:hypothetical protein
MEDVGTKVRPWSFECLVEWLRVREQEGKPFPSDVSQFITELDHSALLERLVRGKRPLPTRPPLSFSYPWYELLEEGAADASDVTICNQQQNDLYGFPAMVINQGIWRIVQKTGDNEYLVTYDNGKRYYTVRKISEDTWRLTAAQSA